LRVLTVLPPGVTAVQRGAVFAVCGKNVTAKRRPIG